VMPLDFILHVDMQTYISTNNTYEHCSKTTNI
jgi:hypothetical protein